MGDYKDATKRCIDLWGKVTFRETISAGYSHTIALKENGTVVAAGEDQYGKTDVSDWHDIIAISAGINYTLGLKSDGTVLAVGADNDGKCEIEGWHNIVAISAGMDHSVALKSDGTVVAVGLNKDEQCEVSGWNDIIAIAAGDYHTVGLKSDGTVVATGVEGYGCSAVEDWTNIVAISAADNYTVGLKSNGTVVVADGIYSHIGEMVEDWTDIVAVSADRDLIVGLKSDGTVVAEGDNDEGQCDVSRWDNIVAIATGFYHTVGLKADGTVVTTGSNEYGQSNVSNWKDIKLPSDESSYNETIESSPNSDYDEYLTWYNIEFASSFLGEELNEDGSLTMGPGDYEAMSNDMYLFDIPGRFSHGMSSADADPVIVDILDWVTTKPIDNFNKILNPLIERYGDDYRVQHYNDADGDAYMWKNVEIYEYVICWQNSDGTVNIRWTTRS